MDHEPTKHRSSVPACTKRRLAQSVVASVDICTCGTMQLHVGAVTLRLVPGAAEQLAHTLKLALARRRGGTRPHEFGVTRFGGEA